MAFLVSPGVEVKEIDLTNVVPAVSSSIGGIAGAFAWGPVKEIVTVGTEKELVAVFGKPTDTTYKYFMPAGQFLQYANNLKVVRAEVAGMLNATSGTAGQLVRNQDDYENATFASGTEVVAKYPGVLGNSLEVVAVTDEAGFEDEDFTTPGYNKLFNEAPGTSTWAAARGLSGDEIHVVVVDTTGAWTGTAGSVLEVFSGLSTNAAAKRDDGTTNYFKDYISAASKYVWIANVTGFEPSAGAVSTFTLASGSDGTAGVSVGELTTAYGLFADADTVDVNLLIGTEVSSTDSITFANSLIAIADQRRDAIAFVSPHVSATVNNASAASAVKTWGDGVSGSSYGVMDSTALYVYDKYNDKYRWIVAAGAVAGVCAYTDNIADPWFSPAGFTRGQLRGVTKLAFNPKQADRDTLYKARINPIVSFPGEGIVLYGDKTAQIKPSAFDRINVRRLFIVLEKAVATASKFSLFEFNDEFTRAQFRNLVEPFLRDVQGRRGVTDFRVVCDDTNNTGEVIDTNRFVADIYIKPARSINFITLNFIATRTGVEFSEIVGAAA